jgi:uncharacterized membrane protein YfhO
MRKNRILPILFIFLVWILLFHPFWLKGLLPIPADIITGLYYPWLDYKWGFPVGVPVKNPLLSDIPSLLYPWRSFAIDQLRELRWPLWNPYYFAGMPLLANFQSAVFSYVNILFLFFPKALAWSFGVMLSPLLTMLAMYFYLRHKNLGSISSLLGGVVFALSGFEVAWMEYNVHGHTALFLPLLLLVIDKVMEGTKRQWLFLLPILVAFQIFAGYIPIVIYSYLVCFVYLLYLYLFPQLRGRKILWKKFFLLFLFWIWGLGLASVQLFPGFELMKSSIRSVDPTVSASNASYLSVQNLLTFIAPDFFGNPATRNYYGKAFYDNFYLFIGTGTLILVIFSIFSLKKENNVRFWWLICLISFLLIFKNPLGLFLERILFLSGGVAARALFVTDFSLAILTGWGVEKLLASGRQERLEIAISVVIIALFFLFAVGASFRIEDPTNRLVAQRNLIIPLIFFTLSVVVLMARVMERFKINKLTATIFVLLISSQLLYSARKYLPFSKKELLFPSTPVIKFFQNEKEKNYEPFRVELGEVIPQNFLMPYGIETISGSDALLPKRMGEFLASIETGKIQEKISRVHLIKNYDSPLFPFLNSKYILAKKQDEKGFFRPEGNPPKVFLNKRYALAFEDKTVQVYEDKQYLPRAFWVYDYQVARNAGTIIELLHSGLDFSKKMILEEEPGIEILKGGIIRREIVWEDYQPGRIQLQVDSEKPGLIFLANNFDPDWKASVDGVNTKIFRANYTFQAIPVPQGLHQIQFFYQPLSFKLGLLTSIGALAVWALAVGTGLLKKANKVSN